MLIRILTGKSLPPSPCEGFDNSILQKIARSFLHTARNQREEGQTVTAPLRMNIPDKF